RPPSFPRLPGASLHAATVHRSAVLNSADPKLFAVPSDLLDRHRSCTAKSRQINRFHEFGDDRFRAVRRPVVRSRNPEILQVGTGAVATSAPPLEPEAKIPAAASPASSPRRRAVP